MLSELRKFYINEYFLS